MTDEWSSYAVALVVLAGVYAILFGVPALLVHYGVITTREPIVVRQMPAIRDWVLTLLNLSGAAALFFWKAIPDMAVFAVVSIYFIAMPWWIWRSVKGGMYFKQHREALSAGQILGLATTNMLFYSTAGWALSTVHII